MTKWMLTPVLPIEISYLELRISQYNQLGGPCDFSVSPSPFGLDFGLWTRAWQQTREELWRLSPTVTTLDRCQVTPGGIVRVSGWYVILIFVSGWHQCSWHRYQNASDTPGPSDTPIDWHLDGGRRGGTKNMEKQKKSATEIWHIVH